MTLFQNFFTRRQMIGLVAILLIAIGLYALFARPAQAQVGIDAGDGAAAWFFQSCTDDETQDLGHTGMALDPADTTGGTLSIHTENGYPGYRFHCTATLANTGDIPIQLTTVAVNNPHPTKLMITAQPDTFQTGKILQPCGSVPAWGTDPATLSADCQVSIAVEVLVLGEASPGTDYGYAVTATLE